MGNPAPWSFRALRACPRLRSTHLSCRAIWLLLDGAPSWRQRGWPQPVNQGAVDNVIAFLEGRPRNNVAV